MFQIKDDQATFECKCPMGFSASLCEISEDTACSSSPCKNGAECVLRSLDEYECRCPEGFSGLFYFSIFDNHSSDPDYEFNISKHSQFILSNNYIQNYEL